MSQLLEDEVGVICMQDDVLIYGKDQQEHDVLQSRQLALLSTQKNAKSPNCP